jgi:hypothetical protein
MADSKYYAWTDIMGASEPDSKGNRLPVVVVKRGSTVSAKKLNISDEDFNQLIESGSVRTTAFPDLPEGFTGSPVDHWREQLRQASEGINNEAAMSLLSSGTIVDPDELPDENASS